MPKTKNFEESLSELEKIVKQLENGETPLDDAIKLFEEGVKISAECHDRLDKAEQKVKLITQNKDGYEETDFDGGEEV